jgi:tRNA 2-thiouridine synthesizing protein A
VAKLKQEGIAVISNDSIKRAQQCADGLSLVTSKEQMILADVVINAQRLQPYTSLLADAGCALDPDGLVRVDDHLATTLPRVFACGYAIKVPLVRTFERKWLLSSTAWQKTALIAGKNAACSDNWASLNAVSATAMLAVGKTVFARTGLNDEEARRNYGDDNLVVITVYDQGSSAKEAQQSFCVRLLFEASSRELIGGEIFGDDDVIGYISLLSHAVREGFTPECLLDVEMMYSRNAHSLILDPLREAAIRAHYHFATHAPMIGADTLALWLASNRDFHLVDVSDLANFSKVGARQIMHVPLAHLHETRMIFPDDDQPIVLFSACDEQSQRAQRTLLHRGFKNVFYLDGGTLTFPLLFSTEEP